jgi:hypothetical protein
MKRTIIVTWMHENSQIIAFVIIDCSYLCFCYHFRPRAESATFFARYMELCTACMELYLLYIATHTMWLA